MLVTLIRFPRRPSRTDCEAFAPAPASPRGEADGGPWIHPGPIRRGSGYLAAATVTEAPGPWARSRAPQELRADRHVSLRLKALRLESGPIAHRKDFRPDHRCRAAEILRPAAGANRLPVAAGGRHRHPCPPKRARTLEAYAPQQNSARAASRSQRLLPVRPASHV